MIQANHGNRFEHRVQFGNFVNNMESHITPRTLVLLKSMRLFKGRTRSYKRCIVHLAEQSIFAKVLVSCLRYHVLHFILGKYLTKRSYEILKSRKQSLEYLRKFKGKCFILKTKDYITKFDPKSYKSVFLGYSQN